MSISANRIIEIKVEESYNSFNLWHDRKLMDFLDEEANFSAGYLTMVQG